MNTAQKIIEALEFTGYPVVQSSYAGSAETYIVFRLDSYPNDFANDGPQHDITEVQLHLFAPFTLNTRRLRKQIRKALAEAGFTYPNAIDASETVRSSDGTEQHVVFECEIEEGVNDA